MSEAERRYQHLRNTVADYHYQVRVVDGRIVEKLHDARCARLVGYDPQTLSESPEKWTNAIELEDRALVAQQTDQVLAGRPAPPIEFRMRHKDGQLCWLEKTVVPYHDAHGILIGYDSLLRDISARKAAEEELRRSESRYRLLFEDDLTGDYVATPDGELLLCNQAFVEIFGFPSRAQAVGSNLAGLYQDPHSWANLILTLHESKSIERSERIVRRNDGSIVHVIENVVGTFDERGRLLRLKGYVFDDTDSHLEAIKLQQHNLQLEEAVRQRTRAVYEQQQRLEAVLNSAFDAIITIDQHGTIQTVNRAAERIFGYTAIELIGNNVKLLMPAPFRDEHDEYLARYLRTGQRRILGNARELIGRRKDGTLVPIEASITEVDHTRMFTGILHDISQRKQLQEHILQIAAEEQQRIGLELHDGIGQELTGLTLHAGTLVELLDTATSVDAAPTGTLPSTALHTLDETHYTKIRELAVKLSQRLNDTIRNTRQLAHGVMPVQIEPEGLQTALHELALTIAAQRSIDCTFACPRPVFVANNTTATHLYRIAQEAVNNALRHSRATAIVISLVQDEQRVVLSVCDNGIGIDHMSTGQPHDLPSSRGMGLRTMQYRCGLIGGSFHVERLAAGGTLVECVAPRLVDAKP